jgi:hypothetical protein|tara:strand:+ start:206 stop:2062 length:1857 start_codon:yes stop_codon:yes gene_type:complete
MNALLLILFFISVALILLSYGITLQKILLPNLDKSLSLGEYGILSTSFILGLSFIIHFFFPLNYFVTIPFHIIGFLLIVFYNKIFYQFLSDKRVIKLYLLTFIIFIPFIIINNFNDDFNYYHLPYLNIIFDKKIVFGLSNINTVLAYPQNAWLDFTAFFRIPILDNNVLYIVNAVIFLFFIFFNIENFFSSANKFLKLYSALLIIFSLSVFSRLRDYGLDISATFILLTISYYITQIYLERDLDQKLIIKKILILSMTAIVFRISSIAILPVVIFICFKFSNKFILIFKDIRFILYCFLISFFFLLKSFIISGCLLYPLPQTCFDQKQISWSVGKEISTLNKDILHSITRGWMTYAKEISNTKDKFVFKNSKEMLTHTQYSKSGISFWIKYWVKDPDIIRILNLIVISLFIILIFIIFNLKKLKSFKLNSESKDLLKLNLIFILPIFVWLFISTPAMRYPGGYSSFLPVVILFILFILKTRFITNFSMKNSLVILISISALYFSYKNVSRVYNDFYFEKNEIIYPWPQHTKLIKNLDFKTLNINGYEINLRLPTNKLLAGNLNSKNNYILHCGNIKMPCMPEKKIQCINNIKKINGYLIITNNNNECLKLMNEEHALY